MEERDGERRSFSGLVEAAPILGPLPTPASWGEEEKSAASHSLSKKRDPFRPLLTRAGRSQRNLPTWAKGWPAWRSFWLGAIGRWPFAEGARIGRNRPATNGKFAFGQGIKQP